MTIKGLIDEVVFWKSRKITFRFRLAEWIVEKLNKNYEIKMKIIVCRETDKMESFNEQ